MQRGLASGHLDLHIHCEGQARKVLLPVLLQLILAPWGGQGGALPQVEVIGLQRPAVGEGCLHARAAEAGRLRLQPGQLFPAQGVSIQDLTPENVLPVWVSDLPGAAAATLVPLGVAGAGVFMAFLGGQITVVEGDRRRCVRWLAAGCLVMAALQFAVLGQLGPDLSAQLEEPFFEVARGVGINGAFQRVESVVVALWAFSDLALLGLLVFACRNMSETLWGERGRKWSVPVVVALTFLGAVFLFPDDFTAQRAASEGVLFGNLLLGFGVPALLRLVQKVKRAGGRAHI